MEPGLNFKGLDQQPIEPEPQYIIPPCPRQQDITLYLRSHRRDGQLCLDTMDFEIPEWTLYRYIQTYFRTQNTGFSITPKEWTNYNDNCNSTIPPSVLQ